MRSTVSSPRAPPMIFSNWTIEACSPFIFQLATTSGRRFVMSAQLGALFISCACDKQPLADRLRAEKRRFSHLCCQLRQHWPVLIVRRRADRLISKLDACSEVFAKPPKIGLAA